MVHCNFRNQSTSGTPGGCHKEKSTTKRCTTCVLPDTFPGIRFDQNGVCIYCQRHVSRKNNRACHREKYKKKFKDALEDLAQLSDGGRERPYDMIMAYSGGKDSSFTLKLLTFEFQLKILAVTFNHDFLSPQALDNIKTVCNTLSVDHLMISPDQNMLARAFRNVIHADCFTPKALLRASAICNLCMDLIKSLMIMKAIEMDIPLMCFGWSPGQIPIQSSVLCLNSSMLRQTQRTLGHCIRKIMGNDALPFVLQDRHFDLLSRNNHNGVQRPLYNVSPLAFLDYDEHRIAREIGELGWAFPQDTDANSTNCLLNAFSIKVHQERFGFHPYSFEIAALVRERHMSREEGLKKLSTPLDPAIVESVAKSMGVSPP